MEEKHKNDETRQYQRDKMTDNVKTKVNSNKNNVRHILYAQTPRINGGDINKIITNNDESNTFTSLFTTTSPLRLVRNMCDRKANTAETASCTKYADYVGYYGYVTWKATVLGFYIEVFTYSQQIK